MRMSDKSLITMKTLIAFLTLLLPGIAFAQPYSIDWHKVAGGGGTSTGATYTVSGTIGQPDAGGAMTGGSFSLTGGFWALYAVQTPGAPSLTITRSGNSAIVSWPATASAFTLQTNSTITPSGWAGYGGVTITNAGTISITITPPAGNLFFRLRSQ
jgi:hypothetical protein